MADRFGVEGALFAFKCWLATMLAAYTALAIGLPRPYWAMITAMIVAQPQAGAVRSKAVYRVAGTIMGGAATVVMVPNLVNTPALLSIAMALWVGVCLYISLLDRTPRSYMMLLAGYTAAIIGFPSVESPGAIFNIATLRVQEIIMGILAATLVHGLIFPRSVTAGLLAQVDGFVGDAERWSAEALDEERHESLDSDRRRLASDITNLHLLATHLPFDTARLLPRVRTVRALQDRLSMLLPVASAVEDRLQLLLRDYSLSDAERELLSDVRAWLGEGSPPEKAQPLAARAAALEPPGSAEPGEMLRLSMLARLGELILLHRQVRLLREQLRSPDRRAVSPDVAPLLTGRARRPLHRDHGFAMRSAVAAVAGILLCCAIWIYTDWPQGAVAAMMTAVFCSLFAALDDPTPVIKGFLIFTLLSVPLATFYVFWLMPQIHSFWVLAFAFAPLVLICANLLTSPATTLPGLALLLGVIGSAALGERYSANFPGFFEGTVAQLAGVMVAFYSTRFLRNIGADWSANRLIRAGWRDVVAMTEQRSDAVSSWTGRMLDRLGLLTPRLNALGDARPAVADMLVDLRVGLAVAELETLQGRVTGRIGQTLSEAVDAVRQHYLALLEGRSVEETQELARIDAAIAAAGSLEEPAARRTGLLALTGLRRNLHPDAVPPKWGVAA